MLSRVLASLWVMAAVAGVAACGKSGSGPVPEGELPARIAAVACDGLANCCDNANRPIDASACTRTVTAELERDVRPSSPRVVYDPSAAGDCVDQLAAANRCGGLDVSDREAPACDHIWRGTVALGKSCDFTDECAPVTFEVVRCNNGVCTAQPRVPRGDVGEGCAFTCPAGASCQGELPVAPEGGTLAVCFVDDGVFCSAGVCKKLRPLGSECFDDECEGAAFCDITSGICRPRKADGATCAFDSQCESGNCEGSDLPSGGEPTTPPRCLARDVASAEQCRQDFGEGVPDGSSPSGL